MLRLTGQGWVVVSKKGKVLSKPYSSKGAAQKRLDEIEAFKHMDEKKGDK